jgi:hypothetical protein
MNGKTCLVATGALCATAMMAAWVNTDVLVQLEEKFIVMRGDDLDSEILKNEEDNVWLYRVTDKASASAPSTSDQEDYRVLQLRIDDGQNVSPPGEYPKKILFQKKDLSVANNPANRAFVVFDENYESWEASSHTPTSDLQPETQPAPEVTTPFGTLLYLIGWYPASMGHRTAIVGDGTSYLHYQQVVTVEEESVTHEYILMTLTAGDGTSDSLRAYLLDSNGNAVDPTTKVELQESEFNTHFILYDESGQSNADKLKKLPLNPTISNPQAILANNIRRLATYLQSETSLQPPLQN